jgi:hypothetical protein
MRTRLAAGTGLLITVVLMVVSAVHGTGAATVAEGGTFVFVAVFAVAWLLLVLAGVPRQAVRTRRRVRQVDR